MEPKRKPYIDPIKAQVIRERLGLPPKMPDQVYTGPLRDIKGIHSVLDEVFDQLGIEKLSSAVPFERDWQRASISRLFFQHTRPAKLENETLFIYVDHPTFRMEYEGFQKKMILKKIQSIFPTYKIKNLKFINDPGR